jgi:hypothetical protein
MSTYHYTRQTEYVKKDGTRKVYVCPVEMNYTPCETSELRKAHARLRSSIMLLTEDQLNYYCNILNKPTDATIKKKRAAVRNGISNLTLLQIQ